MPTAAVIPTKAPLVLSASPQALAKRDEQWEIMAQNVEERKAISHLLECVGKNMSAEEASELGKKNGVIGVDKYIMKSGILVRKAKTAYKKDERFVIIVPGKLLLFLSADLVGKHVRYVTSLIGARVQVLMNHVLKSLELPAYVKVRLFGWTKDEQIICL